MLANGIVSPDLHTVLIGPGSVLNLDALIAEIEAATIMHHRGIKVVIHPIAPVVMPRHKQAEAVNVAIGSTMKGTGAALIEKIQRSPDLMLVARDVLPRHVRRLGELRDKTGVHIVWDEFDYFHSIEWADRIQIEGAQGFSLGIHRKFWPYGTSREISSHQVLSDLCFPYRIPVVVYGCLRTFPIRVANRYNDKGEQVGTSGPYYADQRELTWDEVGQPVELTTVTKLPRRVFTFSYEQLVDAVRVCGPTGLFVNFANYVGKRGVWGERLETMAATINLVAPLMWMGWGPTVNDVEDVSDVNYP
jgi:adenylosuccinate synthase